MNSYILHINNDICIMYFCFIMVEGINLQNNSFYIIFDIGYSLCDKIQNVKAIVVIFGRHNKV